MPTTGLDTTRMLLWNMPGTANAATGARFCWLAAALLSVRCAHAPCLLRHGYYSASLPLDSILAWNIDQFWHLYQSAGVRTMEVEVPAAAAISRVYFRADWL